MRLDFSSNLFEESITNDQGTFFAQTPYHIIICLQTRHTRKKRDPKDTKAPLLENKGENWGINGSIQQR